MLNRALAASAVTLVLAVGFCNVAVAAPGCDVSRRFSDNWFVRMSVSNTGAPCTFNTDFTNSGGKGMAGNHFVYSGGDVVTPPEHGKLTLRFETTQSFADYTPNPGYTGPDHFVLALTPGTRRWIGDVTVGPAR